jgi:hypothetical protein
MDPYAPIVTGASPHSAHMRLFYTTLVFGAISSAICAYLLIQGGHLLNRSLGLSHVRVLVAAESLPAPAARVTEGDKIVPLQLPEQGTATLYDEARSETHAYYLLSGPEAGQSTLYRQDIGQSGLDQLSTSTTYKIGLSLDHLSEVMAYSVRDGNTSRIAIWNDRSKTETLLGTGSHPTMLRGGGMVIFERNSDLIIHDMGNGTEHTLLAMPPGALFAINPDQLQLAVYDAKAHFLSMYSLGSRTEAEIESTDLSGPVLQALFFKEDSLVGAYMEGDTLVLRSTDGSWAQDVKAPGMSLDGLRLSIAP